ncbi:uncharacterized protein F5Z01DRAFT_688838 [Emericellopsis atlantica]|uniref:Uncharacterized protein n=1 Tax=Emericellopsis atlantica TaxID=2614577 RepID=A0A9P8CNB4_9HYPO|nr:uncharacterized protein F5Z01DRAFT_688838 [Emericellopsis atlantica]KAG9253348.1 hypothetical protein F5Z01DRAFT_688838 [Emericellopsis atlantica]
MKCVQTLWVKLKASVSLLVWGGKCHWHLAQAVSLEPERENEGTGPPSPVGAQLKPGSGQPSPTMDRDDAGAAAPKLNEMQAVKAVDSVPAWCELQLFTPLNCKQVYISSDCLNEHLSETEHDAALSSPLTGPNRPDGEPIDSCMARWATVTVTPPPSSHSSFIRHITQVGLLRRQPIGIAFVSTQGCASCLQATQGPGMHAGITLTPPWCSVLESTRLNALAHS